MEDMWKVEEAWKCRYPHRSAAETLLTPCYLQIDRGRPRPYACTLIQPLELLRHFSPNSHRKHEIDRHEAQAKCSMGAQYRYYPANIMRSGQ